MKHNSDGFTLLELVVAIAILGVVSVAATGMVFSALSLRDKVSATTKTQESVRVWSHTLRQAVLGAANVTSSSSDRLQTSAPSDCWSFWFTEGTILYSHSTTEGCVPDQNPSVSFFPVSTTISGQAFTMTLLSTGGRVVKAEGNIQTTLPLDSYNTDYSETVVNLID